MALEVADVAAASDNDALPSSPSASSAATSAAVGAAAVIQLGGVGLRIPMLVGCGFLLGIAGQVVKLCADSAIQLDVDDALRGQVFAVQDSLFWVAFVAAVALTAAVIPADGHSPALVAAGSVIYLAGLAATTFLVRAARRPE